MWPILKKKKKKLKSPTITYLSKNVDKLEISYIAYQNMNWWKPPQKVTCYELVGFRICIPQDSEILLLKKLLHSCAGRDERRCSRRPHGEPRCVRGRTGQGHKDEPDPCTAGKLGELSPAALWRKRTHSPPWTQGSWANTRRATVCTKHKTFAKLKPCCYGSLTHRLSLWRRARKSPPSHSGAWLVGSGRRGNENVTGASETGHHPTSCMMGQVPGRSFYFILHTFHTGITSFTCIFHDF